MSLESEALESALKGEKGWRIKARKALGMDELIKCLGCKNLFEKGGVRKLFCSQMCRILRDPRPVKKPKKLCTKCNENYQ